MKNISLRKADFTDIELIINLAEKAWKPTYANINSHEQNEHMFSIWYSAEGLKKQMNEGQTFWLMKFNDEYIGYAAYSEIEQKIYKLNKIYVLPEQKGSGFGKFFLTFIENKLLEKDAAFLQLNVNRNNQASSFYKACGYDIIREVDIPFGDFWMNDYVMSKRLK